MFLLPCMRWLGQQVGRVGISINIRSFPLISCNTLSHKIIYNILRFLKIISGIVLLVNTDWLLQKKIQ